MELKLQDGDYVLDTGGGFRSVSGTDALVQRALMRLTARRGSYLPLPDYGSRLHTLCRLKPGERAAAARAYVLEALAPERGVSLGALEYVPGEDGGAVLKLELLCGGSTAAVSLQV